MAKKVRAPKRPHNLNAPRREILPRSEPRELSVSHGQSIEEVYGWGPPGSRPDLTQHMRNPGMGDGSWQAWVSDPIGTTGSVDPVFGSSRRLPRAGELVERARLEEARLRGLPDASS